MKTIVNKSTLKITSCDEQELQLVNKDYWHIFDTLEQAETFVFENTPCFSYADIVDLLENLYGVFNYPNDLDKLKELITKKIN
jgi:hypothetical protein